jgi:hypothetical protein
VAARELARRRGSGLEARWRGALRDRHGEEWFRSVAAGEWIRGLWRRGQRLAAPELLAETVGGELDFGELAKEF